MHGKFNLKRRPEKKTKKRTKSKKIFLFSTVGVLLSLLFCAGILISGSSLEPGEQELRQPDVALLRLFPLVPVDKGLKEKKLKIENYVRNGDTIINILVRDGVDHESAYRFFTELEPVYNLRRIAAGNKYTLLLSKEKNEILGFTYEIDLDHYLEAWKDEAGNCYKGKLVEIPYEVKKEYILGEIRESLFASIIEQGEQPELADMMASLFEYDIDFNRDIQENDSFSLLVEKMYQLGRFVRYGHILAVEFTNRGKTVHVIRFTDPEGNTAYYHPDGGSVRKMFLRCPLPFMRVTSRYGNRRHPLFDFSAHHRGVDLGAPVGTKIRATASGIVNRVGRDSIKGKHIYIGHKNQYMSHYYHLSGVAKGIAVGKRVEQGQVIGYVGTTGWSTGPHLHYGLLKGGKFLNPLSLNSPSKDPVKSIYLKDFKQYTARVALLLTGSRIVKIPQAVTDLLLEVPQLEVPGSLTTEPVTPPISLGY